MTWAQSQGPSYLGSSAISSPKVCASKPSSMHTYRQSSSSCGHSKLLASGATLRSPFPGSPAATCWARLNPNRVGFGGLDRSSAYPRNERTETGDDNCGSSTGRPSSEPASMPRLVGAAQGYERDVVTERVFHDDVHWHLNRSVLNGPFEEASCGAVACTLVGRNHENLFSAPDDPITAGEARVVADRGLVALPSRKGVGADSQVVDMQLLFCAVRETVSLSRTNQERCDSIEEFLP
eukprot:3480788-Rhodomonas_salina.3